MEDVRIGNLEKNKICNKSLEWNKMESWHEIGP